MTVVPLVALSRVSCAYPLPGGGTRPALRDLSLAVQPGERIVVLGAGGAGKSTLAGILAGTIRPDAGEVVRAPPTARDGRAALPVGLVTQNPEDSFSAPLVREEMGVVLENLDRDFEEIDRAVAEMLAGVGLAGHADNPPSALSGGQKQLLAVASVLIASPRLLVLDEPLTLLDAAGRRDVERLLARERDADGATVFLSSEVEDAARADRVIVMHRGTIAWEGAPGDLPTDAERLAVWGLLPPETGACGEVLRAAEQPAATGERLHAGQRAAPSVAVEGLRHSYDAGTSSERPVLLGAELEARPGEVLGIVGAIGSGKTTLLQHLNGLLVPQRGRVCVGDRILERGVKLDRLLYRELGLVFQFPEKQLFAETVTEDVAAGLEFAGVAEAEIAPRVRSALERVGLDPDEHGGRSPFGLTWGEKRLAAIAGVLVLETPRIAFDEPGAGLDPAGRRRIMGLIADLAHREGKTVIVVSHHLDDLLRVADRVAVLHEGRIAFSGTAADFCRERDPGRWGLA